MPLSKPSLILNRLAIYYEGHAVYNEAFKKGVNIIRGDNSSGKSTIADFIFYVLGGDFNAWKPEASRCEYVIAEVSINGALLTLKRQINETTRQPMMIYWGSFEKASASAIEGWQVFPFARTQNKESFSQTLFRALGMPEVKGEMDSNITMHQIMRLTYVDQLSSITALMREEKLFDQPLTRETVGELLLGVYEQSLYEDRLRLREKEKRAEEINQHFKNIINMMGEAEYEIDLDVIQKAIKEEESRYNRVVSALKEAQIVDRAFTDVDSIKKFNSLRQKANRLKAELLELQDGASRQSLEIQDSRQFVDNLKERLKALDESATAREIIGQLPLTHCPHCLSPVQHSISNTHCFLCKEEIKESPDLTLTVRMRQEIALQIKESEAGLEEKEKSLNVLMRQIPDLEQRTKIAQSELDEMVSQVKTQRDELLDDLLVRKGATESNLVAFHKQAKAVSVLETLKTEQANLAADLQKIRMNILTKEKGTESRLAEAHGAIAAYVLELLKRDLDREEHFKNASEVTLDFKRNTFAIDGRNQFSASSITYLRNSIHFAIHFASIALDFFRYPRFILCDNIEDKGMEQERSQNLQRLLVKIASEIEEDHQIIFTTSMIDPSLNNTPLCVGQEYTPTNKSLKFRN